MEKVEVKMKTAKIEEELNNCLILFELLGQQYFTLKSLTSRNLTSRPSIFRFIYLVIVFLFISILMVYYIYQDQAVINESLNAKNVLMYAVKNSMHFGMVLVVWTSLIQSFVSTRKIKKIFFNVMETVQLCATEFNVMIKPKLIRNAAWKRISVMIIFFAIVHGGMMILNVSSSKAVKKLTIGLLPIFFFLTIMNKYIFYVGMINHQLEFLRNLIGSIFKSESPQTINIVENMNFHLKSVKPMTSADDLMKKFRAARKIYNIIYENGILINESNGLTILVMLISLVIALTVSGYEMFVIIIGGLPLDQAMGIC